MEDTRAYTIERTETIYDDHMHSYVGPFRNEKEARYYYGFEHNTGQNLHPEWVSEYTDNEMMYLRNEEGYSLASPNADILSNARNLIALEDSQS